MLCGAWRRSTTPRCWLDGWREREIVVRHLDWLESEPLTPQLIDRLRADRLSEGERHSSRPGALADQPLFPGERAADCGVLTGGRAIAASMVVI
jgi:hypothetical protein